MKRIPYKLIISIAVIVEVLILLFIEMKVAKYGPIIFWVIAVGLLINVVMIWRKLTESLKTSNPDIYRKHLISFLGVKRIHQLAFLNKEVLNALIEKQRALSEEKNSLLKYFFLCFVLFGVSSLLTVIKTWYK